MPSSNRICFDAVAASRAKKLNCCGFETCGDCATLWFEHERACPGCRAEASLQKNVEDYSRGVRSGAAGDEVRAVDGDDDDKSASGNGERAFVGGVRVVSPSSPPPEPTRVRQTDEIEKESETASGFALPGSRRKGEETRVESDGELSAASAVSSPRVVVRLSVTGERLSSSRDAAAAARIETHSVEPGIVSIERPEPEPEPVGTRSNAADPAADVAAALRAAAAAVERAAALFARETERATKEKQPPPPPLALSSPRLEPEAFRGSAFRARREEEEEENDDPSRDAASGVQTGKTPEERIEALERELAAMRASSAFSGEKIQKNAHRRLSARDMDTFFDDSQAETREPRSRQKPTPRSASFHTHAQPVHGIAACALPETFFFYGKKNGQRVSVGSFAVATAGWDGDAQVHVFTDFEDCDAVTKQKHRRVDLCATHTLRGHAAGLYACAFSSPMSPTFLATASGDGSVRLWDASGLWRGDLSETFSSVKREKKNNPKSPKTVFPCVACLRGNDGEVNGVAFDTEKRFFSHESGDSPVAPASLAAATDSGAVVFWDVASATRVSTAVGHADAAYGACFFGHEPNALVASVSFDKTCKVWDRRGKANGETVSVSCVATLTGHDDDVVGVDFCSKTSTLATGSDDGTVRLWDTRVWRCLEVLEAPHAGAQVKRVRFSLDGTKLVTAGGDGVAKTFALRKKNADGGVRFLKNDERFSATTLRGHADAVFDAAWVPNRGGRLIVTAGHDAAWRVWDLEEGGYP